MEKLSRETVSRPSMNIRILFTFPQFALVLLAAFAAASADPGFLGGGYRGGAGRYGGAAVGGRYGGVRGYYGYGGPSRYVSRYGYGGSSVYPANAEEDEQVYPETEEEEEVYPESGAAEEEEQVYPAQGNSGRYGYSGSRRYVSRHGYGGSSGGGGSFGR